MHLTIGTGPWRGSCYENDPVKTTITEAMREEMERDERVFVIGEDVDVLGGVFKMTRGLVEQFGAKRVRGAPPSRRPPSSAAQPGRR
jgi:pyruvate/2-oxoglutarate/acetoin dehydrogenase E1 component